MLTTTPTISIHISTSTTGIATTTATLTPPFIPDDWMTVGLGVRMTVRMAVGVATGAAAVYWLLYVHSNTSLYLIW